ncbi:hypothetical protein SAY86_012986 [Trapa natans]|uniref:Stachyose synthase n=1 Tax=Trapa natans TaxID=22666 RepID=A0AAN7MAZ9_TRANT|nr:hypothetical protein SAY86_012986 [Trapa natans]
MAPPNDPTSNFPHSLPSKNISDCLITVSSGKLTVKGVVILSDIPRNVFFTPFSKFPISSDASPAVVKRVESRAHMGGFLGFDKAEEPLSDRLTNSLGKFIGREFVSIFRFKTWWSTMWVGTTGSDIQMETQWVMLNVPEIGMYAVIVPVIEGSFRSALSPGADGHVMICAESGSSRIRASSFGSIAYVHVGENPYTLMKEAYSAIRVHLNTFRLLEEKTVPSLVDKFGWCTWDAFYLTVDPIGIWHGVKEFSDGGVSPRFIIIDDGWQSINIDGQDPDADAKNLVLGGTQMTARLYRFEECEKFRRYKGGSMTGPNAPTFDPKRPKMLIAKAIEVEHAEKEFDKAALSGATDLSSYQMKVTKLKKELDAMFGKDDDKEAVPVLGCNDCSCKRAVENSGMKAFARDLRGTFKGLDDIYVWHALCGAWGGVRPGSTHLDSKVIPCKLSPGLDGTMSDLAVVKIIEGGIGLVDPSQADDLYDSMHSYLAGVGITGVKVDVIHDLEYVSEEYGGRVEIAKAYYGGLTKSLSKNFKGTGLISSMQQCNDFFFLGTRQISIGRVGDDFWFQDPNGDPMGVYWLQGVHMIHCAYNSMWMGQIIQPDWDMFQSDHLCAKFHAGSRAICGGPVYVSDSVGGHDFELIKKLVYPDGTIPRCQHFALPTRDCLFKNPLFDSKTILKIWNFNMFGGVIGAFNCQGAGWDPEERRIRGHSECYKPTSVSVHVTDIEWDQTPDSVTMGTAAEYAVYLNQAGQIFLTDIKSDPIQITIEPSSFEILTFVPVTTIGPAATRFAPIGLTNMFNGGGAIQELVYGGAAVKMRVKGGGKLLAYSSAPPMSCSVNGADAIFSWSSDRKLTVDLTWVEDDGGISNVAYHF